MLIVTIPHIRLDLEGEAMIRLLLLGLALILFQSQALAAELRASVGLALPPYIISDQNKGMELEIVREALAEKGHTLKTVYLPFKRVAAAFDSGETDAALTVNESSSIQNAIYSDSHITYQNVAIGLASKKLKVKAVSDLGLYSVVAFQHAVQYLGADFANMAKRNSKYSEKAKQNTQISLLFSKRTDLVVMDINIYKYYKKLEKRVDTSQPVDVFEVFEPTKYKVAFRDKQIRDDFNEGLKALKASGRYEEIISSYVN